MEILATSLKESYLLAGIYLDMNRMADLLLRVDRIDGTMAKPVSGDLSGIFSISLNDRLLDPTVRLFEPLADPSDAALLGELIITACCAMRAVAHCAISCSKGEKPSASRKQWNTSTKNLDQSISVDGLAEMVHMSRTTFFESFKEMMYMSPLQYAKSVELYTAQLLSKEEKKANEASYLVGYNSPTQFSREFKRFFGYAPSVT
jgi:AraC-like DNA-binding protein